MFERARNEIQKVNNILIVNFVSYSIDIRISANFDSFKISYLMNLDPLNNEAREAKFFKI